MWSPNNPRQRSTFKCTIICSARVHFRDGGKLENLERNPRFSKHQGPVVQKVHSPIHRIVIFSTAAERHKTAVTPRILNSQEIKSDFNH